MRLPENSILNPSETCAVVGGNVVTSQRVTDVVLCAFHAVAASQGCWYEIYVSSWLPILTRTFADMIATTLRLVPEVKTRQVKLKKAGDTTKLSQEEAGLETDGMEKAAYMSSESMPILDPRKVSC